MARVHSIAPRGIGWTGARTVFLGLSVLVAHVDAAHGISREDWQIGPQIVVSIPQDDFENVSEIGGGLGVKGVFELSEVFGVRGDVAYLSYGRTLVPLGVDPNVGTVFGETLNQGFRLGLGPQVSIFPRSDFGTYIGAQVGLYYYRTSVTLLSAIGTQSDTINNNWALGWSAGLGFLFDVGLGPWIDAGLEYHTTYDLPGLPVESPSDPQGPPIEGPEITANEFALKLGVTFFLQARTEEDPEEVDLPRRR